MSVASEPDAILVAEGDALIRMVMVDMLSDAGFAVTKAADAADALALAITHVWRGSASNRIEAAVAQQKQKMRTR